MFWFLPIGLIALSLSRLTQLVENFLGSWDGLCLFALVWLIQGFMDYLYLGEEQPSGSGQFQGLPEIFELFILRA